MMRSRKLRVARASILSSCLLGLVAAGLFGACAARLQPRAAGYAPPSLSPQDVHADAKDHFAERITAENAARRRVGGPHAIGGIDDWAIGNGVLCAVVSAPEHEAILTAGGGLLVDLGHCGRADDQWSVLQLHMLNLSQAHIVPVTSVRAEVDAGEARLVTYGSLEGIDVETTYAVDTRVADALRITSRLTRRAAGMRVFIVGDAALHGHRSLVPFVLSTRAPSSSLGFDLPPVDPSRLSATIGAVRAADLQILVGSDDDGPALSYGLLSTNASLIDTAGGRQELSPLGLNGEHFTLAGVFARPLWFGAGESAGWLQFAQTPFMNLRLGETIEIQRIVLVSERADAASITDRMLAGTPRVRGRVNDSRARIHVARRTDTGDSAPFTMVRPDADGRFEFHAPAGHYSLRVLAPGAAPLELSADVADTDRDLGWLDVGQRATVKLPAGRVMRLVFLGVDGTPDPRFLDDLLDFHAAGEWMPNSTSSREIMLAGTTADPVDATLAPGRYRVLATRGPEYEVTETEIVLGPGETKSLEIADPQPAFQTPGWIAADLHVHAGRSFDSTLPLSSRVRAFAAQGGEVMVSTDHDYITEYEPVIRELGLENHLVAISGSEATGTAETATAPFTIGHSNVFPLPVQPLAYRQGALSVEGRRLRDVIRQARAAGPDTLLQLNHPRGLHDLTGGLDAESYFTHLTVAGQAFRPDRSLAAVPNQVLLERDPATGLRDLDFDLIELLSGVSRVHYRRTRADWLSLLLQGEVRTGTANSDSHCAWEPVALPRNYVRLPKDDVADFDAVAFLGSLRGGHAFGTTGPWLDAKLGDAGPGDMWRGRDATLHVAVRAARWVTVRELRVRVNAEQVHEAWIDANGDYAVPLHFDADAFVTVEVEGEPGDVFKAVVPGGVPLAFTNPIFVDADGDGRWRAPGLPAHLPDVLTRPEQTP